MATIQIPDALDHSLQQLADRLRVSKDDIIRETLTNNLDIYSDAEPELTEAQLARMDESVAQVGRGEMIGSDVVDTWFGNLQSQLRSR